MEMRHKLYYKYIDMLSDEQARLRGYIRVAKNERAADLALRRFSSSRARLVIATKLLIARYTMRAAAFDQTINYFK
ncbi:hypothetical protein vBValSX1_102 [Vibrio phage vB_ValS_X1]|uniref:Uncharacterized protein n=2 Tax=Pogseptimavirus VspSw1 TaxID=2733997 RepID=A0A6M9Z805_9CAUD|nr:hypothetical protein vBValSX1_102 [Vibrio phage vB_ValS_X1]